MVLNKEEKEQFVLNGILSLLDNETTWEGSMSELNSTIRKFLPKSVKQNITKAPNSFRIMLDNVTAKLHSRRVSVKFGRTRDKRFVSLTLNK